MASTKRKRQTKHRGNAAGMVEVRGRTGRKPTEAERKKDHKSSGREARLARLDEPPTWRSAAQRAVLATVIFFVVMLLLFKQKPLAAFSIATFMLAVYIPMGYYTDLALHRRRQKKKAQAVTAPKDS